MEDYNKLVLNYGEVVIDKKEKLEFQILYHEKEILDLKERLNKNNETNN
jgi:hypothetical protein